MKSTQINRLVAEVVNQLSLEGHSIGVDQYLQIQDLLKRLPEDVGEEEIKQYLVPILATSPQEQKHLYNLFEQINARFKRIDQARLKQTKQSKRPSWWLILVLVAFGALFFLSGFLVDSLLFDYWANPTYFFGILTLLGGSIFLLRQIKSTRWRIILSVLYLTAAIFGNSIKNLVVNEATNRLYENNFEVRLQLGDTIQQPISIPPEAFPDRYTFDTTKVEFGIFQALDSLYFEYIGANQSEQGQKDTVYIQLYKGREFIDELTYIITIFAPVEEKEDTVDSPSRTRMATLQPIPPPYYHDFNSLRVDPDLIARADFYERFEVWIKLLIIGFITFFLISILRWRQNEEQQLIAELESHNKPPFIWNIQIPNLEDLALEQDVRLSLNQLRQRTIDERTALDIKGTVKKTAQNAGQISLAYRQLTKPGEYLLLIDRHNVDDHRSKLFDTIFLYFRKEEVEIERFFYDGDPRLCFNEEYPKGISIGELNQKFGDARLIIIGSAHRMLNPFSGKLSKWTSIFMEWKKRAILSPKPVAGWRKKERRLSAAFQLMPASIKGLETALQQFEAKDPLPWEDAVNKVTDAAIEPIRFEGNILDTLECNYSPEMIEWIAACAIYPSLHWDLTLFLGQELSTPEHNLLTLSNLMAINRLPWFVEGKIPDQVRLQLLELLPSEKENQLRKKMYDIFLESPPPEENSVAFDEYKMHLILNELLLTDDPQKKEELEREYAQYLAAGYPTDFAVLKYLEREASPLDFYVPDELKDLAKAKREQKSKNSKINIHAIDVLKEAGAFLCMIVGATLVVGVVAFFVDQYINGDLKEEITQSSWFLIIVFLIVVPFGLWIVWYWLVLQPVQFLRKSKLASSIRKRFPNPYGGLLEKNNAHVLRWLVPLWIVMVVVTVLFDPNIEACSGDLISYQEGILDEVSDKNLLDPIDICLTNPKDNLIYREKLALDAAQLGRFDFIDSINQNLPLFSELSKDSLSYYNSFRLDRSLLIKEQHLRLSDEDLLNRFIADTLSTFIDTSSIIRLVSGSDALEIIDESYNIYQAYPVEEYAANMAAENYNNGVTYYNEFVAQSINLSEPSMQQQQQLIIMPNDSTEENSNQIIQYNLHRAIGYFFLAYLYNTQDVSIREALLMTLKKTPKETEFLEVTIKIVDDNNNPVANVRVSSTLLGTTYSDEDGFISLEIPTSYETTDIDLEISKDSRSPKYEPTTKSILPKEIVETLEITLQEEASQSEEVVVFQSKNGYEGLQILNGKIVVPARFSKIDQDPQSGLFRVQQNSKLGIQMGYIDQNGKIVIPIRYRSLGFLSDGLILAEDNLFGYLDSRGRVVIDFKYEFASDFKKGLAEVSARIKGNNYSYKINRNDLCQGNCPPVYNTMRDDLNGEVYQTVQIGDQVWLAENLRAATIDSWCYQDDPKNCAKYGRLYTWDAAMNACPRGWRLPTKEDWRLLFENSGDVIPFEIQFGGVRGTDESYRFVSSRGHYWSSTDKNSREGSALFFIFQKLNKYVNKKQEKELMKDYDELFFENKVGVRSSESGYKTDGLSCRCIRDFSKDVQQKGK